MKKPYLLLLLLGVITASLQALPMDPIGRGAHEKLNDPEVEDPSMYDPVYVDEAWLTAARRRAHEEGVSDQSTSAAEKRASENTPILESAIPTDAETPAASSEKTKEAPAPTSQKEDRKTKLAKEAVALAETLFKKGEEANRFGKIAMRKTLSNASLEQEEAAYTSAEQAWAETVIAHEEAITKAKRAALPSSTIEELQEILQEAEANRARWNAHGLYLAARKEGQNPLRSSSPIMARLVSAWDKAVEAYHVSTAKASAAGLDEEAEELAAHHQKAIAKKASSAQQAAAEALAKKRELEAKVRANQERLARAAAAKKEKIAAEAQARRIAKETLKAQEQDKERAALLRPAKLQTMNTESYFRRAKEDSEDTNHYHWCEAALKAHETSQAWNDLLQHLTTRQELATTELTSYASFQQARWSEKALLAEIREQQPSLFGRYGRIYGFSDSDAFHDLYFTQTKTKPALEKAFERVLQDDRSEAAIAAVHSAASVSISACAYFYARLKPWGFDSPSASAYTSCDYTLAPAYSYAFFYSQMKQEEIRSPFSVASAYDYTCACAYASTSILASASEVSEALSSITRLRGTLQKKYRDHSIMYDYRPLISLMDKTIHFVTIMKEIKVAEERAHPPSYRALEESGLSAFEIAYEVEVERINAVAAPQQFRNGYKEYYEEAEKATAAAVAAWNEAQVAAQEVVMRWNQEIEKKESCISSLPCSLEEMKDQRERWQQKVLLAEFHALEASASDPSGWMNRRDFKQEISAFVRTKSWPLMKASMEEFIAHPRETVGVRMANPIQAEDHAEELELQARTWEKLIERESSGDCSYELDVTSTTARFLRAVAAFKRAEEQQEKANVSVHMNG